MNTAALYIHIPFCVKKCAYCDFYSRTDVPLFQPYKQNTQFIQQLLQDAAFFKRRYAIDLWSTIYIGGGTPSLLAAEDIYYLASSLCKAQTVPVQEFTVEANPEDISACWLAACAAGGINRLSIGVQSLSDSVLAAVARRGSSRTTRRALDLVKQKWSGLLSCDMIAGLSGQTVQGLCDDLGCLFQYEPDHISLYGLCSDVPQSSQFEDNVYGFLTAGIALLENSNYEQYEVSNFSRAGHYKSVHNCTYWNMENYIGIGPAACGTVVHTDSQGKVVCAERFEGVRDISMWMSTEHRAAVYPAQLIERKTFMEEVCIMGFRLVEGIRRCRFVERFGADITQYIGATLLRWQTNGYCNICDERVSLTKEGLFFLNRFLVEVLTELDTTFVA
ncbi:MAG: coproporphyrinogen-III oxidase family protein [Treponema sp.]